MPRQSITSDFLRSANAVADDGVFLLLIEITHPELSEPLRVINDTKDYVYEGVTWTGFPYDITILSDDESPPQATLALQNVDQVIGESIQSCRTPPRMRMLLLHSDDFNLTVTPRVAIGTPAVEYEADRMFLANVKLDALTVQAQIVGWDYLQRTWPGIRATQNRLPGLFR